MNIPKTDAEALQTILKLLEVPAERHSKETFLAGWYAIAYAFPGLHPDDCPEVNQSGEYVHAPIDNGRPPLPEVLQEFHRQSGWPVALVPYGNDAFRRMDSGELTDDELYPVEAQKAGMGII